MRGKANSVMSVADQLGLEHRLATYGTLAPGRPNAHLLDGLAGIWTVGTIKGHLYERGWGADDGYPGIVLDDSGPVVQVHVFASRDACRAASGTPARCGSAPGSGSFHPRRGPWLVRADPGRARRCHGPWRRTVDLWTISTNPVCAEPIRRLATPARPSTDSTPGVRPSTALTSVWRPASGLQRRGDQRFDLIVSDHPRPARPRLVEQAVTSPLDESVAPLADRAAIQFQPIGYLDIAATLGAGQHDSALSARPAALVRLRTQLSNSTRSSSVNTILAACGDGITHTTRATELTLRPSRPLAATR